MPEIQPAAIPSDPIQESESRPSTWRRILHLVLPASCLGCAEPVWHPSTSFGLCDVCRARLVPRDPSSCLGCGRPTESSEVSSASARCPACAQDGADVPWTELRWAFDYREPLDQVVMGFKFHRLDYLGRQLGVAAAGHVPEPSRFDAVVSVPLHWRRRLRRGYDQAGLVAAALAGEFGLPLLPALRRRRATRTQSLLGRDLRRRNLDGVFAVRRAVEGLRLLLVDDVVTTGSTLEAASRTLRSAGAEEIVAFAVARTPESVLRGA